MAMLTFLSSCFSKMFPVTGLLVSVFGVMMVAAQMPPPLPPPPQYQQVPPPYNMYGPLNPFASSSTSSMVYPPMQQMPPPPPAMSAAPYPPSTSVSYSASGYPMMAAAAPYPSYGMPPPMMYPPPYQTFSGSGPMGDPFTSSSGVCKYTGSRYQSPVAPLFNGFYQKMNMGMVCTRVS